MMILLIVLCSCYGILNINAQEFHRDVRVDRNPRQHNDTVKSRPKRFEKFDDLIKGREIDTVRKEIRSMTSDELDAYFDALWIYKTSGRQDGLEYLETYDDAVAQHALAAANTTVDQAHQYAAFVVWHSVYVREVEIALQSIDPTVFIPYWDWTLDSTTTPAQSVLFTSDYFGSSSSEIPYEVIDGRMAYWNVSSSPLDYVWWESPTGYFRGSSNANPSPYVTRAVGIGSSYTGYPSQKVVDDCLATDEFNQFWPCIWGEAGELAQQSWLHSGVHGMTGGSWKDTSNGNIMGDFTDPITSPNDPLWFSHHAQIDRIWYQWKEETGEGLETDDDPCAVYYGGDVDYPQPDGHNLDDVFYPYFYLGGDEALTVSEGCYLMQLTNNGYSYDD